MRWNCVFRLNSDVPLRPGERVFQFCAVLALREGDRRCLKVIQRRFSGRWPAWCARGGGDQEEGFEQQDSECLKQRWA
jgi:hypothetical protein